MFFLLGYMERYKLKNEYYSATPTPNRYIQVLNIIYIVLNYLKTPLYILYKSNRE
jgi:hypothetical protein